MAGLIYTHRYGIPPEQSIIDQLTADREGGLIALRRDLHRAPELAGQERRTAGAVADRLRTAGLAVTTGVGGHGVVAVLDGTAGAGPTMAYRADMDAIRDDDVIGYPPSAHPVDGDFASQVPGVAHRCGHDLHTTIGVGIAEVLAQVADRLPGRVVFVFQPAEETITGARAMIEAGVLERHELHEIYAIHCGPNPVGTITAALGLPGQDRFRVELSGPTATAAAERLVAAVDAKSTVEFPLTPEEFRSLFASLQATDGAPAGFVAAGGWTETDDGRVAVAGQVRAWPDDRYPQVRDELRVLAESEGGRIEFPAPPFPGMVNSPQLNQAATAHLRGVLGTDAVLLLPAAWPFASEDFALFLERVPGAMFFLGVANLAAGYNGIPHSPDFGADERAIGLGVRAMAGLLASRLRPVAPG